mmetsp:Transcript_141612/g.440252  ORF Transcript_141612/g.440252 Transcript_141612/m.440252 type:complete len:472 (+) Transcript_141612:324-1739(+)
MPGGDKRRELAHDLRQVTHLLEDDVRAPSVVSSRALHQHLGVRLPLLGRDVPRADIAHDEPDARVGGGANARGAVLHGDAVARREPHVLRRTDVYIRSRLEAWRVEVGLAGVDVQVVRREVAPEAGGVHADRHAGLARRRGDDERDAHDLQALQRLGNSRAGASGHRKARHGVVLLLLQQRGRLLAHAPQLLDRPQAQRLAAPVHRGEKLRGLLPRRAHGLRARQAGGRALLVAGLDHVLEGLSGVLAHVHRALRQQLLVAPAYQAREVGRDHPEGHLHGRLLRVPQRAVKVEEHAHARARAATLPLHGAPAGGARARGVAPPGRLREALAFGHEPVNRLPQLQRGDVGRPEQGPRERRQVALRRKPLRHVRQAALPAVHHAAAQDAAGLVAAAGEPPHGGLGAAEQSLADAGVVQGLVAAERVPQDVVGELVQEHELPRHGPDPARTAGAALLLWARGDRLVQVEGQELV